MPRDKRQTTTTRPLDKTRRIISCYTYTLLEILATRSTYFERLLMIWRKPMFSKEVAVLHPTPGKRSCISAAGRYRPHPSSSPRPPQSTSSASTTTRSQYGSPNVSSNARTWRTPSPSSMGMKGTSLSMILMPIFIAINVWPLDRVLRHLATTMKPSARILCRSNHDDVEAMLKADEFSSVFAIDSILKHPNAKSAILFRRKET